MAESTEQMHRRLCGVISTAKFESLTEPHAWRPLSGDESLPRQALAAVRDGAAWYALSPSNGDTEGAYRIFAFHFAEQESASGFVAWLAGLLRSDAGTGAMVVCGFDARSSTALWRVSLGLFDYWGCPWNKGDDVAALIERLRKEG